MYQDDLHGDNNVLKMITVETTTHRKQSPWRQQRIKNSVETSYKKLSPWKQQRIENNLCGDNNVSKSLSVETSTYRKQSQQQCIENGVRGQQRI